MHLATKADPFAELDDFVENSDVEYVLDHLIDVLQGQDGACTLKEIIDAENEAPICSESVDAAWDEIVLNELQPKRNVEAQVSSNSFGEI